VEKAARVEALVLRSPRQIGIESFPRPVVDDRSGLLRVELVGVCGTDTKTYYGNTPYPLPLVLGHEIVGTIEEGGDSFLRDHGLAVGQRVTVAARLPCWSCSECQRGAFRFCKNPGGYGTWTPASEPPHLWGGMAQFMHLAPGSIVRPVSSSVSPAAALMSQTVLANGFQWVKHVGGLRAGQTVVIQGCGPQGLGAAVAAVSCAAARVIVTGLSQDRHRLRLAEIAGATTVVADAQDPIEVVSELTGGRMADLAVNVTGSPDTLVQSMRLVAKGGCVALAGLAGTGVEASIPVDEIVWREITLRGCYAKGVEALEDATALLEDRPQWISFLDGLVTDVVGLHDLEEQLTSEVGTDPEQVKLAVDPWL